MTYLEEITEEVMAARINGMTGEQEAHLRTWAKRLITTKRKQTQSKLRAPDGGRCCLGLAIDVFPDQAKWRKDDGYWEAEFLQQSDSYPEDTSWPSDTFHTFFGVPYQRPFYQANDEERASFKQIGRAILAGLD